MSRAVQALLDDPYFHDKFTEADRAKLRKWFKLKIDKLH